MSKKVIRHGCWESNSSSQHSILVTKNDVKAKIKEWHIGEEDYDSDYIYLWHGKMSLRDVCDGYGRWPFMILTTFEQKLQYAMCEYLGYLYEDDSEWQKYYEEFKSIVKELLPEFEDFDIHTKKDEEEYMEMPDIGTIDHQSAGLLKNFLKDKGISLKEFLTNRRYVVVIDGDEICDWNRYKASGLIDRSQILLEYNHSGEDVEYENWLKEQAEYDV